jgi:hypothetical protein
LVSVVNEASPMPTVKNQPNLLKLIGFLRFSGSKSNLEEGTNCHKSVNILLAH